MATITRGRLPGGWVVTYAHKNMACSISFITEAETNQYIEVVSAQPHPRNDFEIIQIMEMGRRLAGGRN